MINWRGNPIQFSADEPVSEGEKYNGLVKFRDAAGRRYEQNFLVDPGQYRHGVLHDQELVKTLFELQKIPRELETIRAEATKMRSLIARMGPAMANGSSPADNSSAQ